MQYSELLERLKPHSIEQVGRLKAEADEVVYLGNPKESVFPHRMQLHPLYADGDDWDVDDEEIAALCRRFEIDAQRLKENA